MPTDETVLGFSNQWYPLALDRREPIQLTPDLTIFVPEAPVFIATKLEAFDHRGRDDYRTSHDIEDVITLVAGRESLPAEVGRADLELRRWLGRKVRQLLEHPDASDTLAAALPDARFDPRLSTRVRQRLVLIASG
jgi:hypothetical protein